MKPPHYRENLMRAIYLISDGPPPSLKVCYCQSGNFDKIDTSILLIVDILRNPMSSLHSSLNFFRFAFKRKELIESLAMRFDSYSSFLFIFPFSHLLFRS